MASKKKFGAFAGVFTPSILTILGVIMYMRMGWVVGNAGLIGTILIILIAHVIAVSTGLSVSSVATNKKIGAGGIYYVLSRSMGIPIGGSIGIALYVGTAFSIALYLIGFAESFNGYFGLGTTINDLRLTGTTALMLLTALALISTSAALKAQFFILAAIVISLVSIFLGNSESAPETVNMFSSGGSASLEVVFAIFFPAVTGFTAGIAMSGDLENPKKSIPVGTLWAIGVGLVVYITLAVFIAYSVDPELLKTDNNILMKIALFAPAVVAGIWGATLSSAIGGILGAPRILQAMSLDKVTPKLFGKGKGKNNEPVNALILAFVIAETGILIGELDVIARVVSMFYLTAYGFINISFFLESWANPDFQPTFKVKRWIGLIGFLACFAVMFKLDMVAMFGAFAVVGGLYLMLQRKQIQLQSNDVWQSVWSNVVNKGLKRLGSQDAKNANWSPNVILFSGDYKHRTKLLEFGKTVSGKTGIVTDFKLIEGVSTFAKNKQFNQDQILDKLGIYGRKVAVEDRYSGIENIASTYGFSGVEPNTIMMNWSRTTEDPVRYALMTQRLMELDYNLLYLDFDERFNFGDHTTIDIWLREADSKNAELMLNVARYISQSSDWSKAKIRVLFVNQNSTDNEKIKAKISRLVDSLRVDAEIKIINNGVEQKSFYEIIELQSTSIDLILLGVPNIKIEDQAQYVLNTDHLFESVGTTLLVKASKNFNEIDLVFSDNASKETTKVQQIEALHEGEYSGVNLYVKGYNEHLENSVSTFTKQSISDISRSYQELIESSKIQFNNSIDKLEKNHSSAKVLKVFKKFVSLQIQEVKGFKKNKLPGLGEQLDQSLAVFLDGRIDFIRKSSRRIHLGTFEGKSMNKKVKWKSVLGQHYRLNILPNTKVVLFDFGVQNTMFLNKLGESVSKELQLYLEKTESDKSNRSDYFEAFKKECEQLFDALLKSAQQLEYDVVNGLNSFERNLSNELAQQIQSENYRAKLKAESKLIHRKTHRYLQEEVVDFGGNWLRNQFLTITQAESNLELSKVGMTLMGVNILVKNRISRITIKPLEHEMNAFKEAVVYVKDNLGKDVLSSYKNKTLDKLIEDVPQINFDEVLKNEEDKILSISLKSPDQVKVMSADSFNNLRECQNENVNDVSVSLSNIIDFIVRTNYLTPLQESLRNLEAIFKEGTEEIYNSSNLVKYILGEKLTEENKGEFSKSLLDENNRIVEKIDQLHKIESSFSYDLAIKLKSTLSALNIRSIIESIDSYSKVSIKTIDRSQLGSWYYNQKNKVVSKYDKAYKYVVQRKRDVDNINFIQKNEAVLSKIERASKFVKEHSLSSDIGDGLSFYYKKLFSGSHLGNINPEYRGREIQDISNAIERIDNGTNGGLLILGESQSGKSFFIESTANKIGREKVYISKPAKQKFKKEDVILSFQTAFNQEATIENILEKVDSKTVIIIEDIEQWWLKAEGGHEAIDYLTSIIKEYGSKFYFLLSANIHSYGVLSQTTTLDTCLIANVLVAPSRRMEFKEILMSRHKTANSEVYFNKQLVKNAHKLDGLITEIINETKGNTGAGLKLWLSQIERSDDNEMVVSRPDNIDFPNIKDANWRLTLYLLVIHGTLDEIRIDAMINDGAAIFSSLEEMKLASIVLQKSNGDYFISDAVKYYIEEWLIKIKLLN